MIKRITLVFGFYFLIQAVVGQPTWDEHGAIIRSDSSQASIYLCFTGHDYADGFEYVLSVLDSYQIKASFFLTGDFMRNQNKWTQQIITRQHYLGIHSDQHLLYNDWENRNQLLVTPKRIRTDIQNNLKELEKLKVQPAPIWMPPYEWYNLQITEIAQELGLTTVNFSPGTRSNADYTTPEMSNYRSSDLIYESIINFEQKKGMNGFHLLIHPGVHPNRKDKFYYRLPELIEYFLSMGYHFNSFINYSIPAND